MKTASINLMSVAAIASTSLFPFAANAQQKEPEARAQLEEVFVTVRRETENIQSVPVSIVAFSAAALEQKNITTAGDLQTVTPGVFLGGSGMKNPNVVYSIRGQSKALAGPSSPAVISYFAEVPEISMGSTGSQYDLESIQVLKGPQGTLFGRNTTGGAVLISPKEPTYTFGGDLSVSLGNYNDREFKGGISIPLIDNKLAIRVAGDVQKRDGFVKDIGTDTDIQNINSKGGRLSVLFDPVEGVSNLAIFDYSEAHERSTATELANVDPTPTSVAGQLGFGPDLIQKFKEQQALGFYKVNYSTPQFSNIRRTGFTDRLSIDLSDNYELINIFGYRKNILNYNTNVDGVANLESTFVPGLPVKLIYAENYDSAKQLSDELQIRGRAFEEKLEWVAGLFWLKSEPTGPGGTLVAFGEPLVSLLTGAPGTADYNFTTQTSRAVFFNGKYDLDEWLSGLQANIGVRYTKDKTSSCTGEAPNPGDFELSDCSNGSGLTNTATITTSSNATTWNLGLEWQINPDLFTYIATRHGYRTGGANGPTLTGPLAPYQTFDPDTVTDLELGVRNNMHLGDALLRSNISVFSGWYKDAQISLTGLTAFFNPAPMGGTLLVNAGNTRVMGVDFMFTLVPTDRWTIDVGGSLLKPDTLKNDLPDFLRQEQFVGSDPSQIPFNGAPKKSFTSSVRYELPLAGDLGKLAFDVNYYFNGQMEYGAQTIASYGLLGGRIDWRNIAKSGVDVGLFGQNLANKEYFGSGAAAGGLGFETSMVAAPRMYGVDVRYHF
ncbi:MAG: TonB-dependent receptor [Verrucomicrobiaceae bacterium]|nr:TonB-dependent receptor [Verrucomicrobiaceae bacterium]